MQPRTVIRFGTLALISLASCQRCRDGASRDQHIGETFKVEVPPKIAPLAWTELETPQGFGLPSGCRLAAPIRRAKLPEARARFLAPRSDRTHLAIAGSDGKSPVKSAGFVDISGGVAAAPWGDLDAPPLFEHSPQGWIGVFTQTLEPGHVRALLWRDAREPRLAETLAEGDGLVVSDAICGRDRCAILSSLPRAAAAPGARLFVGAPLDPVKQWKRIDLEPSADEAWQPLALAGVEPNGNWWPVLSSKAHTAIFSVSGGRAELRHRIDTPFEPYDATLAPSPLVVAAGAVPAGCAMDGFPIALIGPDGARHEFRTVAAPESVVLRSLGTGAFLAWVGPVSCIRSEQRVVYSALLKADGTIAAGPMAVSEASGFAIATEGAELSLWLLAGGEIALIRARCAIT